MSKAWPQLSPQQWSRSTTGGITTWLLLSPFVKMMLKVKFVYIAVFLRSCWSVGVALGLVGPLALRRGLVGPLALRLGRSSASMSIFIAFIMARQPSYRGTHANKEATRSRGGDKGEA